MTLLDPIKVAAVLAVIYPLVKNVENTPILRNITSRNAQIWILGFSVLTIALPHYIQGTLVTDNLQVMGEQLLGMVAFQVFFYEYVVKNFIKVINWIKG